jgi:soluble lytic murein transglycosylase
MFWLGRLAEKGRNPQLARAYYAAVLKHYPLYYYALQAGSRLDDIGLAPAQASGPALASLSALPRPRRLDASLSTGNQKIVRRGRLLDGLGLSDLAASELRTADYRKPDGHLVGLEIYRQAAGRGDFHYGLRTMKRYGFGYLRLGLEEVSREFWEALFPLPWGDELHSRASLHGIDPYLVAGLIRQESEFDPNARSRAGALGLMQIMPATGRSLARKAGIARHATDHLFIPERSLSLGTLHFREVLDRFGGNLIHTLAGYNAGESRVDQWVLRENFEEPAEFVESIPFTETRGYVQSVLRNAEVYRRLYRGENTGSERSAE